MIPRIDSAAWNSDFLRVLGYKPGRTLAGFFVDTFPGRGAYYEWFSAVARLANRFFLQRQIEPAPSVTKEDDAVQPGIELTNRAQDVSKPSSPSAELTKVQNVIEKVPSPIQLTDLPVEKKVTLSRESSANSFMGESWFDGFSAPYPTNTSRPRFPKGANILHNAPVFEAGEICTLKEREDREFWIEEYTEDRVAVYDLVDGSLVAFQVHAQDPTIATIDMLMYSLDKAFGSSLHVCDKTLPLEELFQKRLSHLGFSAKKQSAEKVDLETLSSLIHQKGSIVALIERDEQDHLIIIDAVDAEERTLSVRDSFHGWSVVVKEEAFARVYKGKGVFFIQKIGT